MTLKDQSGVSASEQWMRERGASTYGAHETSGSLANRVTRPIDKDWYDAVVDVGECLRCQAKLVKSGNPNGGVYMACSTGWQCYHIGWREDEDKGEERLPLHNGEGESGE